MASMTPVYYDRPSSLPSYLFPEELLCPIGMAPMDNPVDTRCGHVFDRIHLNEWMEKSRTCPICRQDIEEVDIRPNRMAISWIQTHKDKVKAYVSVDVCQIIFKVHSSKDLKIGKKMDMPFSSEIAYKIPENIREGMSQEEVNHLSKALAMRVAHQRGVAGAIAGGTAGIAVGAYVGQQIYNITSAIVTGGVVGGFVGAAQGYWIGYNVFFPHQYEQHLKVSIEKISDSMQKSSDIILKVIEHLGVGLDLPVCPIGQTRALFPLKNNCGHLFDMANIGKWIEQFPDQTPNCPLCRREITELSLDEEVLHCVQSSYFDILGKIDKVFCENSYESFYLQYQRELDQDTAAKIGGGKFDFNDTTDVVVRQIVSGKLSEVNAFYLSYFLREKIASIGRLFSEFLGIGLRNLDQLKAKGLVSEQKYEELRESYKKSLEIARWTDRRIAHVKGSEKQGEG